MPQATGVMLHEWSGLLVTLPLLGHLLLNWRWIVVVSKRILAIGSGRTRFNYFWNWALFVMMVATVASGVGASEVALQSLGVNVGADQYWFAIHEFSANSVTIMLGVHLAMHREWIAACSRRYLFKRRLHAQADT